MAQQTHYFLAISLPSTTRQLLEKWKEMIEPHISFHSWIHPLDYHITLAFLGGATFTQINAVKAKMHELVIKHQRVFLELTELGVFGRQDSPRVLWCGVQMNHNLLELQKDIYLACTEIGIALDQRPYNPHITLARKWSSEEAFDRQMLERLGKPQEKFRAFSIDNIVLYQTHMNRSPKYQPLTIFPLARVKR